jgi:outer membrane lipoprotein-sorting protein
MDISSRSKFEEVCALRTKALLQRTEMIKKKVLIFGFAIVLFFALCHYAGVAYSSAGVGRDVSNFLKNLEKTVNKWDTYQFLKESENWKGKKHEKKSTMFRFKKPSLMRTDVLKGKKRGNAVVLNKEGKIIGKHRMGFKKTLKLTDKRLRNIRGYTFMNSSLTDKTRRIKEHILDTGCKATLTVEDYEGKPAYHLHIDHNDPNDEVTDEDVWFEKKTYIILKNIKYEGDKLVTDGTWLDFKVNIPLEDKIFKP